MTAEGMLRLGGPRQLVALNGVTHGFDVASTNDIFTWSVTYLDAEIRGDLAARARLAQMTSVAGGGDDVVLKSIQRIGAGQLRRLVVGEGRDRIGMGD